MNTRIGYLSGAPRVTTREDGESGGARSHVLGVINAYRSLGWDVHPFIYGDSIDLGSRSASAIKSLLQNTYVGRAAADLGRTVLGRRNAAAAVREIGSAVSYVYERYAIFQALGRPFKKLGIPWILETQGLFYYEARFERKSISLSRLAKRLELDAYREASVIVAVTEVLKDLLIREGNIAAEKIIVVPNGVDTVRFRPSTSGGIRNSRLLIGFVGGLLRWQGLDILLRAVAQARRLGVDYDVLIVGDGDERQNLERLAAELGLGERTSFVGRVNGDRVPEYIGRCDICFSGQLPSKIGGMYHSPLKIYEYMAMAKPVLATDFSDARSVIEGKGTGFLFEAGKVDPLVAKLVEVSTLRSKLTEMGMRARDEILRNHSWIARVRAMATEIDRAITLQREQLSVCPQA